MDAALINSHILQPINWAYSQLENIAAETVALALPGSQQGTKNVLFASSFLIGVGGERAGLALAAENTGQKIMVLGRLEDTAKFVGKEGYDVLKIHGKLWDINVNDAWVQAGVDTRSTFELATPELKFGTLTRRVEQLDGTFLHEPAVYLRELKMLRDAGYSRSGNLMLPPNF